MLLVSVTETDEAALARHNDPTRLAKAAVWYASRGWPVFPVEAGGKKPASRHGVLDATDNVDAVTEHWRRNPQHNIGLACGVRFDCWDVDPPMGASSLERLRAEGIIPATIARVYTPRGGYHLYVPVTGDGNAAGVLPGIDYRGKGGYVVAPPSVGANGSRYEYMDWPND